MALEEQMKSEEAETFIRFLAEKDNFGKEFTPYRIVEELGTREYKTTNQRVKEILSLISVKFPHIVDYKRIGTYHLFWIKSSLEDFKNWFKEWFNKTL